MPMGRERRWVDDDDDDDDGTTMETPEDATRRDGDAWWGGDANAFARGVRLDAREDEDDDEDETKADADADGGARERWCEGRRSDVGGRTRDVRARRPDEWV